MGEIIMKKTNGLQPERTPRDIEARSFAIIDEEMGEPKPFAGLEWEVVRRVIHATADFEYADLLRFTPGAVRAGVDALKQGALVITDTEMARSAIPARRMLPLGCETLCLMNDPRVAEQAREKGTTRATAAVQALGKEIAGSIMVIGNAPTALITLLDELDKGKCPAPVLIVGMPVGFVNAAESKELLRQRTDLPHITVLGRKGGTPAAAATVNALAEAALRERGLTSA